MEAARRGICENRVFLILCIMGGVAILSSTMSKSPVLPIFSVALHTPDNLLGIVASASTIPGILISLPAASLSDVVGRRKLLLFAGFVFASAPFLYLLVTNWWQLSIVRFYHGFATAVFVPVAEASVAERFPIKKGERISAFNSATYVGRGLAPFLGGFILLATSNSFPVLYLSVAIAGITAFIIALLVLSESNKATTQIRAKGGRFRDILGMWVQVAHCKGVLVVSLVQAVQYYVYGVVEFYLVEYVTQVAGFNSLIAGVIGGVQIISLIVSRPIMGRFSDRTSRQIPIVLGCLISGALLFLVPFTTQLPALIAISIGFGIGFAMVVSSTSPLMCDLTPPQTIGTSMGFLSTMMDVGQAVGPIISGVLLGSVLGYKGVFASLTLLLFASSLAFLLSKTGHKAKRSKSAAK